MNAALFHRGPDEGSVDAFGRCALGNRRLRIIDLVTGSQPVENEAGDVVCVFNGEIYNFLELREQLAKARARDPRHGGHAGPPAPVRGIWGSLRRASVGDVHGRAVGSQP